MGLTNINPNAGYPMRFRSFLDRPFPPVLLPLLGVLIALGAVRSPAQAQEAKHEKLSLRAVAQLAPAPAPKTKTYVITDAAGYGIADCFKSGASCGRVVASSWCEAHGHGDPAAWGSAADMTATIPAGGKAPPKDALIVTCVE